MTSNGQRTDPGGWNNLNRSLHDITGGAAGEKYKGCGEQAIVLQSALGFQSYDDSWTFTRNGGVLTWKPGDSTPSMSHWWITGKSSNPSDPVLTLDPWSDNGKTKKNNFTYRKRDSILTSYSYIGVDAP